MDVMLWVLDYIKEVGYILMFYGYKGYFILFYDLLWIVKKY